jgi:hypothetical protein
LSLFGAWAFVQAVFVVAGVVLVALQLGLGSGLATNLLPVPQSGPWFGDLSGFSGAGLNDLGRIVLRALSNGGPLGWGVALYLVLSAAIGLLYWSWLASWWARRRHRQL